MHVIQCHTQTNDSDEQDKEEFQSRLLTISQDRPERNVIIVMGDFNAKIGSDNSGYEAVMGQQGLGEINDNGERFVPQAPAHRRQFLPTPKDAQSDLGITRLEDRESD